MSSHRRRAGLALLLALVIVLQPRLPVWSATPPSAGPNLAALVQKFQVMAAGPAQRNAACEIFRNYSAYKHLVATGKVAAPTARAVDEVPVGTLGDRRINKNYIPGKRAKDCIPRRPQASQAATDFEKTNKPTTGVLTVVCAEGVVMRVE